MPKCHVIKEWLRYTQGFQPRALDSMKFDGHRISDITGAPNDNFRKISVRKTIWDLEFSKFLLLNFVLVCMSAGIRTYKKWYKCPFLDDFYAEKAHLEFSGAFFWLKFSKRWFLIPRIFGSLDFQLGNPNRWKISRGQKYAYIYV